MRSYTEKVILYKSDDPLSDYEEEEEKERYMYNTYIIENDYVKII